MISKNDIINQLKQLLNKQHFIYLAAILVAVLSALAVILLKNFAHYAMQSAKLISSYLQLPLIKSLLPFAGILLTVFIVRQFLGGSIEKGSSRILFSVAKQGGIIPKKQMYAQVITSSLTVGLGGSAGLESPITITGAAFGSNFAQRYQLSQQDRILLLACGVAAGIGAAFNAPIAGVLFAVEVVLTDITISAFIPIIIAAATGAMVSNILLKEGILLAFVQEDNFSYKHLPPYILLGLLTGLVAVYHARRFRQVERFFNRIKNKAYKRALFGASLLAVLIFLFPALFGEGYESIHTLAGDYPEQLCKGTLFEGTSQHSWLFLLFLGLTALFKAFATGITLGSGGNGGNFAPALFVGSFLGFILAKGLYLLQICQVPSSHFMLVGMAGMLSGLFHAPLTAIFLIGEITGGYYLMIPLMVVSSISFAMSKRFEQYALDVKTLADKGQVFTSNKDRNILSNLDLLSLVDRNYIHLSPSSNLQDVVAIFSSTNQKAIAIVDQQKLTGIVYFDQVRPYVFNSFRVQYQSLHSLISEPVSIKAEEGIEQALLQFETAALNELPVLANEQFIGFLSKTTLLENYRQKLQEMIIE